MEQISDIQRHEAVKLIADSSRRLATLVNNTFDLSHLLSGDAQLELKHLNITNIIQCSIEALNNSGLYHTKPMIVLDNPRDYYLMCDEAKIQQVVNNLLINAIKWTSSSKIITVELREGCLPNTSMSGIQCCIKDQGIKIPEDELHFIFEPFTESSNTASKACGVGLGLAICKEIIKLHNGEIWVENNIKEGVTFNFIIPHVISGAL